MKRLDIDYQTRKRMDFMLIPLKNVIDIGISEDDDYIDTDIVYLAATEGITFLNAKKFIVNGKSLDELLGEQEGKK